MSSLSFPNRLEVSTVSMSAVRCRGDAVNDLIQRGFEVAHSGGLKERRERKQKEGIESIDRAQNVECYMEKRESRIQLPISQSPSRAQAVLPNAA